MAGPGPGRAALLAIATAGALAGHEVAGRAARDGLFLSELAATQLPVAILASAALAIASTFGVSAWLRRSRPERVGSVGLVLSGALFVATAALVPRRPRAAAMLLYLHMTGIAPVLATAFWSVVNERFDPWGAKRVVSRMAAAAALGGVLGGLGAERLATHLGFPALLVGLGVLSALCGIGALGVGAPPSAAPAPLDTVEETSGLRQVSRLPLLRRMALLMLAVAVAETLVDYALKVEAAAAYRGGEALVRFFAAFYVACGLVAFGIQAAVGNRFLRRFGVASAVAMLPASVALTGSVAVAAGKLWSFALARGAETVASLSFFRSGFQLLYTPVPPAVKRPAKAWVDVASGSLGEILGAAGVLAALALLPGLSSGAVAFVAVLWCLVALAIARDVHRGYVRQLAQGLRTGRIALSLDDAVDATTHRTLLESRTALNREALLAQVRAFDAEADREARHAGPGSAARDAAETAGSAPGPGDSPLVRWVSSLDAPDAGTARRLLRRELVAAPPAQQRRIVGHVVPLLGDPAVAAEAEDFLRALAPRAVGQLADALLDPDEPASVRVGVARVLASAPDARAMDGLWRGLASAEFDVRLACARAAARLASRDAALAPSRDAVHGRVSQELAVDEEAWARQGRRPPGGGERSVLLDRHALQSVSRSLEHVFTLLSLAYPREMMASALAGVSSAEPALRGTALEYLEVVLPASLCRALLPRLDAPAAPSTHRSREEVSETLLRSSASVVIDRDRLGGGD